MIDMLEKEPLNVKPEASKDRIPENYQLRYFTEMEVAGIMGFPKCFSFPSELTTRQVTRFPIYQFYNLKLALRYAGQLVECKCGDHIDEIDGLRRR